MLSALAKNVPEPDILDLSSTISPESVGPDSDPPFLLVEDRSAEQERSFRAALERFPETRVLWARYGEVPRHAGLLSTRTCLPIGSRAFVVECLVTLRQEPPFWTCYPKGLRPHMLHRPRRVDLGFALTRPKPLFVKATKPEQFGALVLRTSRACMSEMENLALDRLLDLPAREQVWISEVLDIESEWRYYVHRGDVVGFSPIQAPGSVAVAAPEMELVSALVAAAPRDLAFGVDLAVLRDGRSTLLCARDALGLELFPYGPNRPCAADLIRMMWTRWQCVVGAPCATGSIQQTAT